MDRARVERFRVELITQCHFAQLALDNLNSLIVNSPKEPGPDLEGWIKRVWYAPHNLLIAAGNISKMLWPAAQYARRGQYLRRQLGVPDDSPLGSRALRNHFEHLDERLETWEGGPVSFDMNIGPVGAFLSMVPGAKIEHVFRNFDPGTYETVFVGERFDLRGVVRAIRELQARLRNPE
jgi:hypothetical protein